ncbi:MAG: YdcF family protein [Erysipelotrichaceae bacterium]|nr:YdcF family protein [Erysipelotrichaceae bacterium]
MKLFDTLDKKPKLYHIAVLSAVMAVLLGILYMGGKKNAVWINLSLAFYDLTVIGLLIHSFIGQLRYNPYSYNTIFYFGYALFLVYLLIGQILLMREYYLDPDFFNEGRALSFMSASFGNFIIFSFPFLLIFCVLLCISNISLIRHEGRSFVNVLGILLSVLIIAGVLVYMRFNYYVSGSREEVLVHDLIFNAFASVYLYFECMLLGTMFAGWLVSKHMPDFDRDYMIVLGCGMNRDGTPTPLLRGRIDAALDFYHKQKEASGKALKFVPSGGQGPDEIISESECMARYLLSKGIKEEEILREDKSTNTYENMSYSKELILNENKEAKISFATSKFHILRAGLFARRVKMRATGIGASTKWYFWPNAAVREFIGLLTRHKLKQALILTGTILASVLLTMLEYR